jgi:hypothetical protein
LIEPLYVLLVRATAGEDCEQEPGSTRDVMVIAQGDEGEAHDRALVVLARFGWTEAEVRRQAPLALVSDDETPDYLRSAIRAAREHGAQIVIYDH